MLPIHLCRVSKCIVFVGVSGRLAMPNPFTKKNLKKMKSRYNKAYLFVLFTSDRGLEKGELL